MFEKTIKGIVAGEGELLEKALLGAQALVDYTREQLKGMKVTITINIESPEVKRAEPV